MSEGELRILFVEDSADDLELSVRELRRYGMVFDYRCVDSEWGLMAELESYRPDIVLCDFVMPGFSGRTALQIVRQRAPFLPFCFLSGRIGEVSAIESIKEGATDYILKQNLSRLPVAVERALKEAAALRQQRRIDEELRLRSGALDAAANSIVITDREGVIRWVNRSFTILTGYSFEEAIGQTPRLLKSGVQGEAYYSDLWQTIISGNVWHGELVNRKKDGSTYFEEETITPVRDPSGVITHFVAVKQEITERKEQERRIRRLNRIYEVLSRINSLIIRVSDRQELFDESCIIGVESGGFDIAIVDTYDSASDVFATVSSYGVNREHVELLCQEGVGHINQRGGLISRAILEKKTVFSNDITSERVQESPRRRISRELGYRSLVVLPLLLDSTVVATLSLISREKGFLDSEELKLLRELSADISFAISHIEKSARAEFLAFYNPVTELPNRRLLIERLRLNMTDSSRRCAVVLIDVERFRNVNLSLGRSVGDSLLVQIAARLGKIHNDQIIVAHTERDHFIVAFGDIQDISEIAHFVEAVLLMTFGEPYMVDKEILHVASRAGVAIYPDDAIDVEDLLRNADQAL